MLQLKTLEKLHILNIGLVNSLKQSVFDDNSKCHVMLVNIYRLRSTVTFLCPVGGSDFIIYVL